MLATNQRYRMGELDLVMRDGETVVFVEVRYRRSDGFGGSAPSVDAAKQRKIVLAAQCFLVEHPELARAPCRFDVVAVDGAADAPRVEWIRNAFDAD
jgi:putative endonuclease